MTAERSHSASEIDLKKVLHKNMITLTIIAATPHDAYEIAWIYFEKLRIMKAPWGLDTWHRLLHGPVELYFIFPLATRRNHFLKEIKDSGCNYEIFVNNSVD